MFSARKIYISLMLAAGAALGAAAVTHPSIANGPVPPYMWLLVVSLIIDVAMMAIAASKGSMPLDTNSRLIGFFGAAVLYLAVTIMKGVSPFG